jgi:5-methylcytosine-specific restriction endonuclease McrA
MFRSYNPIRRSPLRRKSEPRVRKQSWRTGRVREDAQGMLKLRTAAFARSEGVCECWMQPGREGCFKPVYWSSGHLHHVISRAHGGSDVLENLAFTRPECHDEITGKPEWRKSA